MPAVKRRYRKKVHNRQIKWNQSRKKNSRENPLVFNFVAADFRNQNNAMKVIERNFACKYLLQAVKKKICVIIKIFAAAFDNSFEIFCRNYYLISVVFNTDKPVFVGI